MQLSELVRLSALYCPARAFSQSIFQSAEWGPGHELAHALVASPRERQRDSYGLSSVKSSTANDEYALHVEAAAMHLSFHFHRACKRADLIDEEVKYTDWDSTSRIGEPRTKRLLRSRSCMNRSCSLRGLEEFCLHRGLTKRSPRIVARRVELYERWSGSPW